MIIILQRNCKTNFFYIKLTVVIRAMLWALDRFTDGYAVLQFGDNTIYINSENLPDGAREGSLIQFREEGPRLMIDEERRLRTRNRRRLQNLFARGD